MSEIELAKRIKEAVVTAHKDGTAARDWPEVAAREAMAYFNEVPDPAATESATPGERVDEVRQPIAPGDLVRPRADRLPRPALATLPGGDALYVDSVIGGYLCIARDETRRWWATNRFDVVASAAGGTAVRTPAGGLAAESVTAELPQASDPGEEDDEHPTFRPQTVRYGTLQAGDPELDRLVSVAANVYGTGGAGVAESVGIAAYLVDACRSHLDSYRTHLTPSERQRQTDDAKVEAEYEASLRRHHADEREALRSVLQAFRNEVCGMISVIGMEHLKQQVGTTTVRVLMARIDEADAVLDSVRSADAETED